MTIKYLDAKRIRGVKGEESSTMGTSGDVTEVGGVTLNSTYKVFGSNSIDLDGTDNAYLNMDGVLNAMSTTGTVSYWVRNGDGTAGYFLTFNRSDNSGGSSAITYMHSEHHVHLSKMDTTLNIGNSIQWQVRSPADSWSSSDRGWHHVVLTQDGTAVKFYFDGTEQTSFTITTDKSKWISDLTSRDNVRFGVKNVYAQGNVGEFTGQVDDIAIWDRAITAAEVTTLYGGGQASGTPVTALGISRTGLKAYWSCNSLDGTTLPNEAASIAEDKATLVTASITDEKFVNPDANTALQWEQGVAAYKVEGNKILAGHTLIGKTISEISGYYFSKSGITFTETVSAHLFNSNGTKKGSFGTINVNDTHREANQGLHDTAEIESHGGLVSGSAVVAEGDIIGFMNDWALDSGTSEWCSMGKKESDSALTDTHYQQLATFVWTGSALTPTLTDDKSIQCQVKTAASSDLPENTLFEETDSYKTYWLQSNAWKLPEFVSYSAENDNDATNGTSICSTRDFLGIRIVADSPLIGRVVSSVTWKLAKVGSPTTNNILGRIYSGAANTATGTIEATSTNTILVSTVTNGDEVTLNFDTSYKLEENSAIMFGLDSTSSGNDCGSNYITFRYLSNTTNNTDFRYTQWAGSAFEDGNTGYSTWVKID